jgi:signal peptidase I
VAERQPGSPEPADGPRTASGATGVSTDRTHDIDGAWAASVEEPAPAPTTQRRDGTGESEDDRGLLSFLRELPVLILLAFALALLLKTFVVQAFFIPSGSMEPTLMPGDRVLVEKVLYHPSRGDIIVFEDPDPGDEPDRGVVGGFLHWLSQGLGFSQPVDEDFIKRVIGVPGDSVELRNGELYVNGSRTAQSYLSGEPDLRDYGPKKVPPRSLFVLGDNRLNSNDSRFGLGFVPEDRVVGKAFVVIWPPSRIGWLH